MAGWTSRDREVNLWDGRLKISGTPSEGNDLITKQYFDDNLPSVPDLLNSNNTWTGTNTFSDDVTHSAEVKGTKQSLSCSLATASAAASTTTTYFKDGEVQMSADKGWVMTRAGSLTDLSLNYNLTQINGIVGYRIEVKKNGTNVMTITLDNSVANNKKATLTQARGTDTFVADDVISLAIFINASFGESDLTVENMIAKLGFYENA